MLYRVYIFVVEEETELVAFVFLFVTCIMFPASGICISCQVRSPLVLLSYSLETTDSVFS